MATEATVVEAAKSGRQRSPNYPAVGLREAVERVRKFIQTDGKAGAPPELAAKHIGYSSAHGQAMSVLAALKKFGLVAESSGRLVPTQAALEIVNLPESDARRSRALKDAALSPALYKQLVDDHMISGLPAPETLEAELTTYKGFNPKAVAGFVSDFLDTLDFAGITVGGSIKFEQTELIPRDGVSEQPEDEEHRDPPPRRQQSPQQLGVNMREDVFSLDNGGVVTISWPVPLTQEMVTDIKDWLKIVERKITRSATETKTEEAAE